MRKILKLFLSFCLVMTFSFSSVHAESENSLIESFVIALFEAQNHYSLFNENGDDVTELFYQDNLDLYQNNDYEQLVNNFHEMVESAVIDMSLPSLHVDYDGPGNNNYTRTYNHLIYHNVYSSLTHGNHDVFYTGDGYYTYINGNLAAISYPATSLCFDSIGFLGNQYWLSLYRPTASTVLSTKKVNYSTQFMFRHAQTSGYAITGTYSASVSIFSDGN